MRILIINRFFWPDESSTSMLATDLAEDFIRAGHEVHVLCARLLYDRPETPVSAFEIHEGMHIHRLFSTRFGRRSVLRRISDLVTFQINLHLAGPWICKPDVVLVMTDPPMVLSAALLIKTFRGAKIVHHVMDVYPEIAVSLGTLRKDSLSVRAFSSIYRFGLRRCDLLLALGERMAERLAMKGANPARIRIARPWADDRSIRPLAHAENSFRKELGIPPGDMLVMYSGNMGRAHGFETIIAGMRALRDEAAIHFVFIGDGAKRAEIERAARDGGLQRIRILPYQPRERLGETLTAADVHLVSQDPKSLGLIVPSKLAGILAAGRPALFVGDPRSEIAECLTRFDCGAAVEENDAEGFARRVREWAASPERIIEMGRNARLAFEKEYARSVVVGSILDELSRLA